MSGKGKVGRGRPKLTSSQKKETVTVSIRLNKTFRDSIADDAIGNGRTTNAEIVERLKKSVGKVGNIDDWVFGNDQNRNLMRLIGMMIRNLQAMEGDEVWLNRASHKEMKEAIATVLDAFGPDGGRPKERTKETVGQRRGRSWLTQFYAFRKLPKRLSTERLNEVGEYVDFMPDERVFPEIWQGLGLLAEKLNREER